MTTFKSKNIFIMNLSVFVGGLLFFLPIYALYFQNILNSIQLVTLVFSIQAIFTVLLEVPTGMFADFFGRKTSIILSWLTDLFAITILYFANNFFMAVIAVIFHAIGHALYSGADTAIIYDTLKEEKKEHLYKKVIGKYYALWPIAAVVGSLVGGYFATISYQLTVSTSLIPTVIGLVLVLFLKEPSYHKNHYTQFISHTKKAFSLLKSSRQLISLFLGTMFIIMVSENIHLISSIYYEYVGIPLFYFGILSGVVFFLSGVGHYISHWVSEKIGNKNLIIIATVAGGLTNLVLGLWAVPWVVMIYVTGSLFYGLRATVISDLINKEVPSSLRATMNSLSNFSNQLGIALFAPILGYSIDLYSMETAILLSGIFMILSLIAYAFLKKN